MAPTALLQQALTADWAPALALLPPQRPQGNGASPTPTPPLPLPPRVTRVPCVGLRPQPHLTWFPESGSAFKKRRVMPAADVSPLLALVKVSSQLFLSLSVPGSG